MDLHEETARLAQLIEERLDIRGADFATKLRRAGRLLPRHVRAAGATLVAALSQVDHPRLSRQIDQKALTQAIRTVEGHLKSVDPWDRRMGIFVNWASGLALSLLVLVGLVGGALFALGYL